MLKNPKIFKKSDFSFVFLFLLFLSRHKKKYKMLLSALSSKIKIPSEYVKQNKDSSIPLWIERAIKTSSCTHLKASLEAEAMINLGDFGEPWLCPRWAPNSPCRPSWALLAGAGAQFVRGLHFCLLRAFLWTFLARDPSSDKLCPLASLVALTPDTSLSEGRRLFPPGMVCWQFPALLFYWSVQEFDFYKDKGSRGWNSEKSHKKMLFRIKESDWRGSRRI